MARSCSRTKILRLRVGELNAASSEVNTFPEELSKLSTVAKPAPP